MKVRSLFVICFFVLFAACGDVDLYHGLDQAEAGEISVLLNQNGINAKTVQETSGNVVSWKLTVPSSDVSEARKILVDNSLPHKRELGLSGVYKDKGIIPTPDEQKARFLLALKGEIINSLIKIPGVADVDVVLNIPQEDKFSLMDEKAQRPTASVIIRGRPGQDYSQITEEKIQQFVANTVSELHPSDVTVIMTQMPGRVDNGLPNPISLGAETTVEKATSMPKTVDDQQARATKSIAGLKMDPSSAGRFRLLMLLALSALMLMSIALIVNVVRLNQLRQKGSERRQALPAGGAGAELASGTAATRAEGEKSLSGTKLG